MKRFPGQYIKENLIDTVFDIEYNKKTETVFYICNRGYESCQNRVRSCYESE